MVCSDERSVCVSNADAKSDAAHPLFGPTCAGYWFFQSLNTVAAAVAVLLNLYPLENHEINFVSAFDSSLSLERDRFVYKL